MVKVTKLNGKEYYFNCELIETIEATPDTVITTVDGKKYVILESIEQLVQKVIEYKRLIHFPTYLER